MKKLIFLLMVSSLFMGCATKGCCITKAVNNTELSAPKEPIEQTELVKPIEPEEGIIPKVSLDVVESTTASITDGKDFWKKALDKMFKENPLLYQLLVVGEMSDNNDDFKNGYQKGALLIYLLLSRQIEAEDMNENWG